jgi:hypothetical protein
VSNRADGVESDQVAKGITATMTYKFHAEVHSNDSTYLVLLCDVGYNVGQCLSVDSAKKHVFA